MNCKNCGLPSEPGANFCLGCGSPIEKNSEPLVGTTDSVTPIEKQVVEPLPQMAPVSENRSVFPEIQSPVQGSAPNPNVKSNKNTILIIIGIVVLVLGLALGYYFINKDKPSNNNNQSIPDSNNNIGEDDSTENKVPVLNRNYKIESPALANSFKKLTFEEGSNYLRSMGFTSVDASEYYGTGEEKLNGYDAFSTPYKNLYEQDYVRIIFEEGEIKYTTVELVFVEADITIDKVYTDLTKVMSAFNGYELNKEKLSAVYNSAKMDVNSSYPRASEEYALGNLAYKIDVIITPADEFSPAVYNFRVTQSFYI